MSKNKKLFLTAAVSAALFIGGLSPALAAGTVLAGGQNTASGDTSSVSGGWYNTASGKHSSVSGGDLNTASGQVSSVSGGGNNTASGSSSSVSGGRGNTASGEYSSVSGGGNNTASGSSSSVSGGVYNKAIGKNSSVSGGWVNKAIGEYSSAFGGEVSVVQGAYSTGVAGGSTGSSASDSLAAGYWSTVTVENGTAIGYQATTNKDGTIAFGHDSGDVSGYTVTWKKDPSGDEDYTQTPTITENTYSSAYYNRLVKIADGIDAHDAVTVEQLNKAVAGAEGTAQGLHNEIQDMGNRLTKDINRVGAGSAALAALHPQDFNPDDKWDFAVGYGHYKNANASAVGAFYRPNAGTTVSLAATIGNGDPQVSAGVSFKIGMGKNVEKVMVNKDDYDKLNRKVESQAVENQEMKQKNNEMEKALINQSKEISEQKAQIQELRKAIEALSAK